MPFGNLGYDGGVPEYEGTQNAEHRRRDETNAYNEGVRAARLGDSVRDNPYYEEPFRSAWTEGWLSANEE